MWYAVFTVVTTRVSADMQRFRTEEGGTDDPYGPLSLHVLIASETASLKEKRKFLHAFAPCFPKGAKREIK